MKHFNIPIFIPHLGCPYDCIYCNQKVIAAQHSIPDVRQVVQTIEEYLLTIPPAAHVEVAFFGGNFTAVANDLQESYLSAVRPYLESGRVQSIRISTRPDYIDKPGLQLLAHYGVKMVELGVQSMDDLVLNASSRSYSHQAVRQSAEMIKNHGLDLGIQLMVGLPGDSYQRDLSTTQQVISLTPQAVRIYPTLVITGTRLADWWAEGKYVPLSLTEAVNVCRDMYMLFQQARISVIRMGLYPGQELMSQGVIKAGPFHPSFGELVEQAVFAGQMEQVVNLYSSAGYGIRDINLHVHPRDLSKAIGHNRSNIRLLRDKFDLAQIRVVAALDLERDSVGISQMEADQPEMIMTRMEFLAARVKELAN